MPQSGRGKVKSRLEHRQDVNRWAALIIPAILLGAVGYATWVVVVLVGFEYLLRPGPSAQLRARPGAGLAIMISFFLLLLPMAACYFRTVSLVFHEPTYVPKGPHSDDLKDIFVEEPLEEIDLPCCKTSTGTLQEDAARHGGQEGDKSDVEKHGQDGESDRCKRGYHIHALDTDALFRGTVAPPPGMSAFHTRPFFQCDPNGLPIWCATCRNWKPDRVHHCSDVGRCVLKLDHFCPWVGGVVGEANFKFFVQFNFWAAVFCTYVTAVMAWAIAERTRTAGAAAVDVTWIIVVALSGLFLLFTGGMAVTSAQHVLGNLTTVDAIDAEKRTVFVAVRLADGQTVPEPASGPDSATVTVQHVEGHVGERRRDLSVPWQGTITYPFVVDGRPVEEEPRRTFVILCTPPGLNPWDLGPLENWRDLMGESALDWFFPVKMSPCMTRRREEVGRGGRSMYALGPKFKQMLIDAGIDPTTILDGHDTAEMRDLEARRRKTPRRDRHRVRGGLEEDLESGPNPLDRTYRRDRRRR